MNGNLRDVVIADQRAKRQLQRDIEVACPVGTAIAYDLNPICLERVGKIIELGPKHEFDAAVDDAVGRATEMGKPVLYIPGIMDMDDIQTIASMVILGRVARKTAEYGSALLVPTSRSVVMSVAQEVVKEGYIQVGRPDAYNKENIQYLTDDQFGYAAGVDGIIVREKPAAIFLLGTFYAESLILPETGRSVGAIQIAGTAMPSQIPFFVAACDYTLIGEELFAASAYLSREPKLLGSLKGQDAAKLFFMILIVVGVISATIGDFWSPLKSVAEFLRRLVTVN